jgi:hypothetical protein
METTRFLSYSTYTIKDIRRHCRRMARYEKPRAWTDKQFVMGLSYDGKILSDDVTMSSVSHASWLRSSATELTTGYSLVPMMGLLRLSDYMDSKEKTGDPS